MGKLFKFMKPYAATILMIVVFLVLQAYCDLSLPGYTSDIVNVGIQQGGIDSFPIKRFRHSITAAMNKE